MNMPNPGFHDMGEKAAVAVFESGVWKEWSAEQKVAFQLFEERLCMPFGDFQAAVEEVLERPVFTHEFAFRDHLVDEFLGKKPKATFAEVLALIPAETLVIVEVPND